MIHSPFQPEIQHSKSKIQNSNSPHPTHPSHPVRIFISTGEVSGDLQGSLLIAALKQQAAER
ncbi:MAG: hypothetical protein WCA35_19850, partial [Kovacikia sp.]